MEPLLFVAGGVVRVVQGRFVRVNKYKSVRCVKERKGRDDEKIVPKEGGHNHSASNWATVMILQSPICPISSRSSSPETRKMA